MEKLNIGHGSGGRLTSEIIFQILQPFRKENVSPYLEDCAIVDGNIAITIDGYTISPRSFPGGNIGELAICGSVNDLAMRGAKPNFIAMGLIAEEGLAKDELLSHMESAAKVCSELSIQLVTGDTKVLPKGQVDGLYITTCAIGTPPSNREPLGMHLITPGDVLIVTTEIGQHEATIAALRYGLSVPSLQSDCAPLWPLVEQIIEMDGIKCMRDCTRGGLGTVLCEWAESTSLGIEIEESKIPISNEVSSLCDILGFDPLYLACEGCAVIAVAPETSEKVLSALKAHKLGEKAQIIGKVTEEHKGYVGMNTKAGGRRLIDMPVGEMLPRIC